ncbi:NADH dehydrogenase subunit 6 [Paenibacillus sp. 481]|nr:NADH dehydrogenase subunit 6 [Paenibacillus sp. 481]
MNPISVKAQPYILPYVNTFFQQNWHLFAPTPMTVNFKIYVRAEYKDTSDQQVKQSQWFDVSSSITAKNQETVFSPYNRITRIGTGYVHRLQGGGKDDLSIKLLQKKMETKGDTTLLKKEDETQKDDSREALYRYASSYAKKALGNQQLIKVQFMISVTDTVPYSKRNDKKHKPEKSLKVYEWKKVDEDVIAFP